MAFQLISIENTFHFPTALKLLKSVSAKQFNLIHPAELLLDFYKQNSGASFLSSFSEYIQAEYDQFTQIDDDISSLCAVCILDMLDIEKLIKARAGTNSALPLYLAIHSNLYNCLSNADIKKAIRSIERSLESDASIYLENIIAKLRSDNRNLEKYFSKEFMEKADIQDDRPFPAVKIKKILHDNHPINF